MIACDTNVIVAYFDGDAGAEVDRVDAALSTGDLVLPPVVITEVLSDPKASAALKTLLDRCTTLAVDAGYWARAGALRETLLRQKLKARTADALIAQSCIDHDVALITRYADFRHFAKHCGLKLA